MRLASLFLFLGAAVLAGCTARGPVEDVAQRQFGDTLSSRGGGNRTPGSTSSDRKVAFLVGVNKYDHAFSNLKYAERDVEKLDKELRAGGFEVVVLKGSATGELRATRKNIETQLRKLLDGKGEGQQVKRGDLLLVSLNGHGVQMRLGEKEDAFFCPVDTLLEKPETLLALTDLVQNIIGASRGSTNLILVDACRNEAKLEKRGIEGRHMKLPTGTAILFSCGQGQTSVETSTQCGGHGLFTYAVLKGLRGEAAKSDKVSWGRLVDYVQEAMASDKEIVQLLGEDLANAQKPVHSAEDVPHTVLLTIKNSGSELMAAMPSNDAVASNSRGLAWTAKKDYDKAIKDFDEAIRLNPKYLAPYFNRGMAWFLKKNYDKAIQDFDDAIRLLTPQSRVGLAALAYFSRGDAWRGKKEYDKAIQDFDEAIRLSPEIAYYYPRRGDAWFYKRDYFKAKQDFDQAIRLDPTDAYAYYRRGLVWLIRDYYDWAIQDFNEAIRLNPKYALAYRSRADAWSRKKDFVKASRDYDAATRLDH